MAEEIVLRDWQKQAFEELRLNGFRGILDVATGKGKTVFAIHCIKELQIQNPNLKVAIIVPTINLLKQWETELSKFLDLKPNELGLFYGEKKQNGTKITIFVINSAIKENGLEKLHKEKKFDFIMLDECHHYGAETFSKILSVKIEKSLGLSATPERYKDQNGTQKIYSEIGEKFYKLHHEDEPLAIPKFIMWHVLVNLNENEEEEYQGNSLEISIKNKFFENECNLNTRQEDFMKKISEMAGRDQIDKKVINARRLIKLWSLQAKLKYNAESKIKLINELVSVESNNKIIIFNERIETAKNIFINLKKEFDNLNLFIVHSELKKDENINTLNQFRKEKTGVLIVAKMVDEGYDVPDASVAIIASFTGNPRQMIQRDGRILRQTPEKLIAKRYALVIKNVDEEKYFNVILNSGMKDFAKEGRFVEYVNDELIDNDLFKQDLLSFENLKKERRDSFKSYIESRLNYYERDFNDSKFQIDPVILEKRQQFFSRFRDVILEVTGDNPEKYPLTIAKLKVIKEEPKIFVDKRLKSDKEITEKEKEFKSLLNNFSDPKLRMLAQIFPNTFQTKARILELGRELGYEKWKLRRMMGE